MSDFEKFLNRDGDHARELVERVTTEAEFARSVLQDEEQPKPLRAFALLALELGLGRQSAPQGVAGFRSS